MYGLLIYGQCTVCLYMASARFAYLWPVYDLFIYGQCTVCLFMANGRFVYLWPVYGLFINVHWPSINKPYTGHK
jgi:hypothetical protein